jgi:hypothetical protein
MVNVEADRLLNDEVELNLQAIYIDASEKKKNAEESLTS